MCQQNRLLNGLRVAPIGRNNVFQSVWTQVFAPPTWVSRKGKSRAHSGKIKATARSLRAEHENFRKCGQKDVAASCTRARLRIDSDLSEIASALVSASIAVKAWSPPGLYFFGRRKQSALSAHVFSFIV